MRESSDTTKCVTMLRHLAGTIILILFGISCAEQRSWTEVTFEHDSYIKVPLTINGVFIGIYLTLGLESQLFFLNWQ